MKDHTTSEAAELTRSCILNLSSCYLNLKDFDKCVAECNIVLSGMDRRTVHLLQLKSCMPSTGALLAGDADNLKALYRRGQAFLGLKKWIMAKEDLEKAVRLSASDPSQQKLIKERLQEAKDQIGILRANGELKGALLRCQSLGNEADMVHALHSEEATPEVNTEAKAPPAASAAPGAASTPAAAPSSLPFHVGNGKEAEMLVNAQKMMAENPEMAKMAAEMMKNMKPEDLAAMTEKSGIPGIKVLEGNVVLYIGCGGATIDYNFCLGDPRDGQDGS